MVPTVWPWIVTVICPFSWQLRRGLSTTPIWFFVKPSAKAYSERPSTYLSLHRSPKFYFCYQRVHQSFSEWSQYIWVPLILSLHLSTFDTFLCPVRTTSGLGVPVSRRMAWPIERWRSVSKMPFPSCWELAGWPCVSRTGFAWLIPSTWRLCCLLLSNHLDTHVFLALELYMEWWIACSMTVFLRPSQNSCNLHKTSGMWSEVIWSCCQVCSACWGWKWRSASRHKGGREGRSPQEEI